MSLLLKALQQADRGSSLTPDPMQERPSDSAATPPASAKAAAALMLQKQAGAEKRRLLILLGVLATVVLGMGIYFYLAIFMPWVFLPKPPAAPATIAQAPLNTAPPATPDTLPPVAAPTPPVPEALPLRAVPPAAETVKPLPSPTKPTASAPAKDHGIQISGGSAAPAASGGGVMAAYRSLQEGHLEEARRAYENLRVVEPSNADVLLGLGLIAQRQGRTEDAAQWYLKALDADPKNTFAQASLSGIIARADPAAAEAKLKALIAQQPAAFLFFGLGNVYAGQGRWNDAQAAYFEAQRQDLEAPDYAFNLAVSLERIGQPRLALDYYQRALKLAQAKPAAFDAGQAKTRIQQLRESK